MANRIEVIFDASSEQQASARIKELVANAEAVPTIIRRTDETVAAANAQAVTSYEKTTASVRTYAQVLREEQLAARAAGEESVRAAETAKAATASKLKSEEAYSALLKRRATETAHLSEQGLATRARLAEEAAVKEEKAAERAAQAAARAAQQGQRSNISPFGLRRAIQTGAQAAGLPGIVGGIGGLEAFGGPIAGIGIGIAALASIRELIKLSSEAEQAQLNLAVAARATGRSFGESEVAAKNFRAELHASYEESVALAKSFGELQLRSGEAVRAADLSKFTTLAQAQGLKPEDAAKAIESLSRGQLEGFQALTGETAAQGQLLLDRYARSVGTTTEKLTEMERAQVLSNEALKESGNQAEAAAARMQTLQSKWEAFKQTLSEVGESFVTFFDNVLEAERRGGEQILHDLSGGLIGRGPEQTYKDEIAAEDARQAALNRQAIAHNLQEQKAREAQAEITRQELLARNLQKQLSDQERESRALPEDFQAGLSAQQKRDEDIARLRKQREQLQAEFDAFKKIQNQFKPSDADAFTNQFIDSIQQKTDQIRSLLDAAANDTAAAIKKVAEEQRKAAESAIQSIDGVFNFLKSHAGKSNPFVAIYDEARQAAEDLQVTSENLRKQFGAAADEIISKYEKINKAHQAALAEDALGQRFEDRLNAQNLREQAKALRAAAPQTAQQQDSTFRPDRAAQALQGARDISLGGNASDFLNSGAASGQRGVDAEAEARRIAAERLRALVAATDAGRIFADPRQYAAQAFKYSQDEQFSALVNARDAGRFIGDPSQVFNPRAAMAAASQSIIEARNAARLIRETQAEAEAQGVNPDVARRLADEQIIKRVQGRLSAADLSNAPDLKALVADALDRQAERTEGRESEALKVISEQSAQLKQLTGLLNGLVTKDGLKVNAGPAAQINISAKDLNAETRTLGPAFTPDSLGQALPGFRE